MDFSGSSSSVTKGRRGGTTSGGTSKDEIIARARAERDERRFSSSRARLEKFFTQAFVRRRAARCISDDVINKCSQLKTLSVALKNAKGIDFCPPSTALVIVVSEAAWVLRTRSGCACFTNDMRLLEALLPWLEKSALSPATSTNVLASANERLSRHLELLFLAGSRLARCERASHATRLLALTAVAALTGQQGLRCEAAWASAASLRSFCHEGICFRRTVTRSICAALGTDYTLSSVAASQFDRDVASVSVLTALYLCSSADTPISALTTAHAPGPASDAACASFVSSVLSVPFLIPRLAGTPAAAALGDPALLLRLVSGFISCPTPLVSPAADAHQLRFGATPLAAVSSHHAAASSGAQTHQSAVLCAWPAEAYLLGNLVQLLADPPAAATALHPLAASLPAPACAQAINLVCDLMACLPDSTWTAATPMVWKEAPGADGAPLSSSTQSGRASPYPMPPLLVSQLRRLSSERLATALARVCVDMRTERLANPRLRLPPDEDPDRKLYDEFALEAVFQTASGAGSHLSSTPSLPVSLARGLWESSKLAVGWLKRKALGEGGRSGAGSEQKAPAAAPPSPAPQRPASSLASPPPRPANPGSASRGPFEDDAVFAFCRLYAFLVAPRPHAAAGSSTAVSRNDSEAIIGRMFLLNGLAFSPNLELSLKLWSFLVDRCDMPAFVAREAFKSKCSLLGPSQQQRPPPRFAVLTLFASVLGHACAVVDDFELYRSGPSVLSPSHDSSGAGGTNSTPSSLLPPPRELRHAVRLLRDAVAHAEGIGVDVYAVPEAATALSLPASPEWPRFASAAVSVLRALHERHAQRALGPSDMWIIDVKNLQVAPRLAPGGGATYETKEEAVTRLLAVLPFAVPFMTRAERYDRAREAERQAHQVGMPQVPVQIHRARLFDSAYAALGPVRGEALKRKIAVRFVSAAGHAEIGIDAGGLFKEAFVEIAKVVFDPTYGLFAQSEAGGDLYPNPASALCSGLPEDASFEFVGRLVGKALFEGITLGPRFARFWLHRLLGRLAGLHQLPSLDPELYKSLMFLKTYAGDVEGDLCLTFTVASDVAGGTGEVELVPGGSRIPVTSLNRMRYIHLAADWRLNVSIERQTAAFLRGLHDIMPASWLAPFSAPELQVLLSGSCAGVDVEDLRQHTRYAGGYGAASGTVRDFWSVVRAFSERDKAALLRFVTSSDRSPPLGFSALNPSFTIQKPSSTVGTDALPTASTCFNVLVLPPYASAAALKQKLLLAIHSGTGFELT